MQIRPNLIQWRTQDFELKQANERIYMFLPQNIQFLLILDTILAFKLILEQALLCLLLPQPGYVTDLIVACRYSDIGQCGDSYYVQRLP